MAEFDSLPELVRHSRLETVFQHHRTIHTRLRRRRGMHSQDVWIPDSQEPIGSGGYGEVWVERKLDDAGAPTPELRAVKRIRAATKHRYYMRELEALAKFSSNSHKYAEFFVQFYGWYESPRWLFVAMEYCQHGDLRQYLNDNKRIAEQSVQEITLQVLGGLSLMHEAGFAHRDVKPANILIKSLPPNDWWVKLADLGLSKRADAMSGSSTVRGTRGFEAPEVQGLFRNDPKSADGFLVDMWGLGETVFRALTGQPTFEHIGGLIRYIEDVSRFPKGTLEHAQVGAEGIDFVRSLMAPHPQDRLLAKDALEHAWISTNADTNVILGDTTMPSQTRPTQLAVSEVEDITEAYGAWTKETVVMPVATNAGREDRNSVEGPQPVEETQDVLSRSQLNLRRASAAGSLHEAAPSSPNRILSQQARKDIAILRDTARRLAGPTQEQINQENIRHDNTTKASQEDEIFGGVTVRASDISREPLPPQTSETLHQNASQPLPESKLQQAQANFKHGNKQYDDAPAMDVRAYRAAIEKRRAIESQDSQAKQAERQIQESLKVRERLGELETRETRMPRRRRKSMKQRAPDAGADQVQLRPSPPQKQWEIILGSGPESPVIKSDSPLSITFQPTDQKSRPLPKATSPASTHGHEPGKAGSLSRATVEYMAGDTDVLAIREASSSRKSGVTDKMALPGRGEDRKPDRHVRTMWSKPRQPGTSPRLITHANAADESWRTGVAERRSTTASPAQGKFSLLTSLLADDAGRRASPSQDAGYLPDMPVVAAGNPSEGSRGPAWPRSSTSSLDVCLSDGSEDGHDSDSGGAAPRQRRKGKSPVYESDPGDPEDRPRRDDVDSYRDQDERPEGGGGTARRVMDFFRRRGKERDSEERVGRASSAGLSLREQLFARPFSTVSEREVDVRIVSRR